MKRLTVFAATFVLLVSALTYSYSDSDDVPAPGTQDLDIRVEEENPWTHLKLKNRPENFQFAVVTDRTGGHRPGVFPAAVQKLNLLQPEFVVSVGDLIEGYTEDRAKLDRQWKEFNGFVRDLEMPFFYVPGNHDISNKLMVPVWQEQFGRTYYHFLYHDVLFLVLNSEDPPNYEVDETKTGHLGDEQLAWARRVLRRNRDVRWTVVLVHKPMWTYGDKTNWNDMAALLDGRPHTVFAGHHHRYAVHKRDGNTYYTLATTGGGSKLKGPAQGQFDHVVWITMTGNGPRPANLMLDGIWTDNPVEEARARQEEADGDAE